MFKLPNPFRKQGQQIGPDGYTNAMCDYYTSEQMLQFRRDVLEEAAKICDISESTDPINVPGGDDGIELANSLAFHIRKLKEYK